MSDVGADSDDLQIVAHLESKAGARRGPVRLRFRSKAESGRSQPPEKVPNGPRERNLGARGPREFHRLGKGQLPSRTLYCSGFGTYASMRLAFNRNPQTPDGLDFPELRNVLEKDQATAERWTSVAFDCLQRELDGDRGHRNVANYLVASQFLESVAGLALSDRES